MTSPRAAMEPPARHDRTSPRRPCDSRFPLIRTTGPRFVPARWATTRSFSQPLLKAGKDDLRALAGRGHPHALPVHEGQAARRTREGLVGRPISRHGRPASPAPSQMRWDCGREQQMSRSPFSRRSTLTASPSTSSDRATCTRLVRCRPGAPMHSSRNAARWLIRRIAEEIRIWHVALAGLPGGGTTTRA